MTVPYGPAGFPLNLLQAEIDGLTARNAAADAVTQPSGYVRSPHPLCQGTRCQAPALTGAAEQAGRMAAELFERFEQQERNRQMTMTPQANRPCQSLWCEQGGHSFSERDPGMRVVVVEGTDETGAPVNDSRTMCGGCAPKVGTRLTRPPELGTPGPAPAAPVNLGPAWSPHDLPDAAPRL